MSFPTLSLRTLEMPALVGTATGYLQRASSQCFYESVLRKETVACLSWFLYDWAITIDREVRRPQSLSLTLCMLTRTVGCVDMGTLCSRGAVYQHRETSVRLASGLPRRCYM